MKRACPSNSLSPADENVLGGQSGFWMAVVVVTWIAVLAIAQFRYHGPPLVGLVDGSDDRFVGVRAEAILKRLVGNGRPHPVGTADHQRMLGEIQLIVRELGYRPELQHTEWSTAAGGAGAIRLTNVMFRLEGQASSESAVMLAAHYDSAASSPGAGDDGAGVAVLLEVARMFKQLAPPRNDIIFLITDGEELGLLGARQFCSEHRWAKEVAACVNLEARGTSGPSLMFQTSDDDRWLIEMLACRMTRPYTSSLYYEIYRRLPNDTDFTVFKRAEIEGFNLAFIGNVNNYHTPNDSFENVSRSSLQHQGDNAWQLMSGLSEFDWAERRSGRAVYFDLFGWILVWWPAETTVYWAGGLVFSILLAAVFAIFRRRKANSSRTSFLLQAVAAMFIYLGVATATVALVSLLGRLLANDASFRTPWPIGSQLIVAAYWLTTISVVLVIVPLVSRRSHAPAWLWAVGLIWAALALVFSVSFVGASWMFLIPASVFGLALLVELILREQLFKPWAAGALGIATGVIWLPNELLFFDALGFRYGIDIAIRAIIVCGTLTPLAVGMKSSNVWRLAALCGGSATALAVIAILQNRLNLSS